MKKRFFAYSFVMTLMLLGAMYGHLHMGFIRRVMESNNVTYQTAELGKVDLGGGGTIAYIMALYGMNVIDCGVAVLNMHHRYQ